MHFSATNQHPGEVPQTQSRRLFGLPAQRNGGLAGGGGVS